MTVNASLDQQLLLEKVGQYTEPNRRTDKLAVCMQQFGKRWDASHTAFIGLQLRALGWVTTFKDTGQYARWDITPTGKAVLCELRNTKKAEVMPAPVTNKITEFMVVGEGDGEISPVLKTLKEAEALAEKWAREEPGCAYRVLGVYSIVKANITIEKV